MRICLGIAAVVLGSCGAGGSNSVRGGGTGETHQGPTPNAIDLRRDLEATVLEGYSQLSLGNLEAYGDTVADDEPIVLIGVGPKDVHVGDKSAADLEVFRIDPCIEVLSKNLEVHLSRDRSVGWTFDDISCRLPDPFEGRSASIPLRVTAVYQRHLDTWVMVMQHVSYGLPLEEVLLWARTGRLVRPAAVGMKIEAGDGARKLVRSTAIGIITDRARYRSRKIAGDDVSLLLWTGPSHEYHGVEVPEAPQLEELIGDGSHIRPGGIYVGMARNKQLAWVAANLVVTAMVLDDPVTVRLRATYVFERRDDSPGLWIQVQAHVSAPVLQRQLSKRVFGLEIPDLSDLSELPAPTPGE